MNTNNRIPKFNNITTHYPEMEVQVHEWKGPENKVDINVIDEVTIRIGTLVNNIPHLIQYVIVYKLNKMSRDKVIGLIKKQLIKEIENNINLKK